MDRRVKRRPCVLSVLAFDFVLVQSGLLELLELFRSHSSLALSFQLVLKHQDWHTRHSKQEWNMHVFLISIVHVSTM